MTDAQLPKEYLDIKPCPFCGSRDVHIIDGDTSRWRMAECNGCGAKAPDVKIQTAGSGTPKDWEERAKVAAMAEWNKRISA